MELYLSREFWSQISASHVAIQGLIKIDGKKPKPIFENGNVTGISISEHKEIITVSIHYSLCGSKSADQYKTIQRTLNNCSEIRMENHKLYVYQENEADVILTITFPFELDIYTSDESKGDDCEELPKKKLRQYNGREWDEIWEKLVIIRHGDYKKTNNGFKILSSLGKSQIIKIAAKLQEEVSLDASIVFSSVVSRAMESAIIIAHQYKTDWEAHECLGRHEGGNYSHLDTLSLLFNSHKKYKTIILVTHLPFCRRIGGFLNLDLFGEEVLPLEIELGQSNAIVIDLKSRSYELYKSGQ